MALKKLNAAVARWSPLGGPGGDPIDAVRAGWTAVVGDDVARHSRPEKLADGTLIVVTRSSAWSQQLALLASTILAGLAPIAGAGVVQRLRFRVGKPGPRSATAAPVRGRRLANPLPEALPAAASLDDAIARLRRRLNDGQRAKREAGLKFCSDCGASLEHGTRCAPCEGARGEGRRHAVEALLFDTPWLGFEGIAALVPEMSLPEYEAIRSRTLARWWTELQQLVRRRRPQPSERERSLASSFVLLKTGTAPEAVREAVLRNELGDDLHDILYRNKR